MASPESKDEGGGWKPFNYALNTDQTNRPTVQNHTVMETQTFNNKLVFSLPTCEKEMREIFCSGHHDIFLSYKM